MTLRIAVIQFPGSNDDRDALWSLKALGADASLVWHADPELPAGTAAVAFEARTVTSAAAESVTPLRAKIWRRRSTARVTRFCAASSLTRSESAISRADLVPKNLRKITARSFSWSWLMAPSSNGAICFHSGSVSFVCGCMA